MITITLTAAEWASVQPDGTLWLVRSRECSLHEAGIEHGPDYCDMPMPAEFVQACAPCARCKDTRVIHAETFPTPCPYCRVELVGPCPTCKGMGAAKFRNCTICDARGTVTLGYAYAIGQPLPIVQVPFLSVRQTPSDFAHGHTGPLIEVTQDGRVLLWTHPDGGFRDITAALAHYGPLIGKWAMQLAVTDASAATVRP